MDLLEYFDNSEYKTVSNVLTCECGGRIVIDSSSPYCTSCYKVSDALSSDTMILRKDGTVGVDVRSVGDRMLADKREKRIENVYKTYEKLCDGKGLSRKLFSDATKVYAATHIDRKSKKRSKIAILTSLEIASIQDGNSIPFNEILNTLGLPTLKRVSRKRLKSFYGMMVTDSGFNERSSSIVSTILRHLGIHDDGVIKHIVLEALGFLSDECICMRDSRDNKTIGLLYITLNAIGEVSKKSFITACEKVGVKYPTINKTLKNLSCYDSIVTNYILSRYSERDIVRPIEVKPCLV